MIDSGADWGESRLTVQMRTPLRSRTSRRSVAVLAAGALLLSACGEGDATREDLIASLTEQARLSAGEAECVAVALYDSGDWEQGQLNNAAKDPSSVDGFQAALDETLADCIG